MPQTKPRLGGSVVQQCFWVALAYTLILICTWSIELGDTANYASMVADHFGRSPFGTTNSLWEFAHLIWRPLGWLVLTLIAPLLNAFTDWTIFMKAAFALIAINWVAGIITVVLWYRLLVDLMKSRAIAFIIVLAVACAHGFILYVHSGSSYNPALACLTGSIVCIRKDRITWAGILYGLSALFWIPYLFCGLGLFVLALYPADWSIPIRESIKSIKIGRAIRFTVISFAFILAVYAAGMYVRGVRSPSDVNAWITDAGHGWSQSQRALRMVTGLPRSTFYLGHDGLLYKRYLRHDPYAPVKIVDLIQASLWKLAIFYLFLAALLFALWRYSPSGWPLLLFFAGVGPIIFFAVFILESGAPDRYLPVSPYILLAVGWALRDVVIGKMKVAQTVIFAFLLIVIVNNVYVFAAPRINALNAAPYSRIAQLRARIDPKSEIILITNQDTIEEFFSRSLFGSIERPFPIRLFEIIEPGSDQQFQWREGFAAEALRVWNNGGEVWLTRRFFAEKPKPEWNWVEKDNPNQVWSEVYSFFHPLQTDMDLDGSDGFSRLAHSEENLHYLTPFATAVH